MHVVPLAWCTFLWDIGEFRSFQCCTKSSALVSQVLYPKPIAHLTVPSTGASLLASSLAFPSVFPSGPGSPSHPVSGVHLALHIGLSQTVMLQFHGRHRPLSSKSPTEVGGVCFIFVH
eukprot:GGOE01046656.1.p4 GENE.GGOE01046656.1~~GGOE01046656.1.p4  ORF type:complete len:118 (-),score=11.11 GGOE01046656.1:49-402(-)